MLTGARGGESARPGYGRGRGDSHRSSVVHPPASLSLHFRPAPPMWSEYAMPRKRSWIGDGEAGVVVSSHDDTQTSHGMCPACLAEQKGKLRRAS